MPRFPTTRREFLQQAGLGFGAVALTAMQAEASQPTLTRRPHHAPRAKSVIFLYMDGGPSQVDTFDPKPMLHRVAGRSAEDVLGKVQPTQFNSIGTMMPSPWAHKKHGQCGHEISELFPHVAAHADKLCLVRSLTSNFPEHTAANYFLHTGSGIQGRPSMGAWVGHALGTENANLPSYVVLNGGLTPPGGLDNFNSGFLPAALQASVFRNSKVPLDNLISPDAPAVQSRKLDLIGQLDAGYAARTGSEAVEAAIANYETAARMQTEVPDLLDISDEPAWLQSEYGLDASFKNTGVFGRQCLLARRLVERGVRFIELTCPKNRGDRWDQHRGLIQGHNDNALSVDQPIAALLGDLDRCGLLDDTLVVWAGEFGRTPFAQGKDGRDHNPSAFTIWMAGGGAKPGHVHGRTDEFGYRVVENRLDIHDLHGTMLHLLGIDHERATVRFSGRDMRLTDVHGRVIDDLIA